MWQRWLLPTLALAAFLAPAAPSRAVEEADIIRAYESVAKSVVLVAVEGLAIDPIEHGIKALRGSGSGFAIKPGLVVTNYHVIGQALRIEVVLSGGRSARGPAK